MTRLSWQLPIDNILEISSNDCRRWRKCEDSVRITNAKKGICDLNQSVAFASDYDPQKRHESTFLQLWVKWQNILVLVRQLVYETDKSELRISGIGFVRSAYPRHCYYGGSVHMVLYGTHNCETWIHVYLLSLYQSY